MACLTPQSRTKRRRDRKAPGAVPRASALPALLCVIGCAGGTGGRAADPWRVPSWAFARPVADEEAPRQPAEDEKPPADPAPEQTPSTTETGPPVVEPAAGKEIDPDYIQTFPKKVTTKFFVGRKDLSLDLKGPSGAEVQLKSNSPVDVGLSVGWWWLGGTVSFATSPGAEERGDTESFNFQWIYYGRRFHLDLLFYEYSGFYFEDGAGGIELFDDLTVRGSAISAAYHFNPARYSGAAAFKHTQRQRKSSGSPMILLSVSTMNVSTANSMIPAAVAGQFMEFQNLRDISFFQVAAGAGYGYTYVWSESWYLHAGARGAAGVHTFDYESGTGDDGTDFFFRGLLDVGIGYNGKDYFAGFEGGLDAFANRLDDGSVDVLRNRFYVFFGTRF